MTTPSEYDLQATVVRAAVEGIPTAAIARIVAHPFTSITEILNDAMACGKLGAVPRADWPPTAKMADRTPQLVATAGLFDDFLYRQLFRLTPLEAGFMVMLMRHDYVEKERLHGVVETKRAKRQLRPDKQDQTEIKMVDVIICKLRKKLKAVDEKLVLITAWGAGYYFEAPVKLRIAALVKESQDTSQDEPDASTSDT